MPIQFTTDGSPGYRRLALWQDIVCDVFVGLDCKSDLGSAFRGSVTQATLGKAVCSDVCSDRQHVFRTPSRGRTRIMFSSRSAIAATAAWCRTAARP
jgi:hypothetical protein